MTAPEPGTPEEPDRVVIRDKRKIDPATGEPRPAHAADDPEPALESGQVPMVEAALLDERTHDLQRLQAEYANYRKRADRERTAAGDVAISRVLAELLPVLDDIDRAREHGDLTGALKAVADHLETIFGKLGLESFGEVGDPFDPNLHEAVLHNEGDDVTEPTCTTVLRRGYRHGERLLRAAMVGVTDPTNGSPTAPAAETQPPSGPDETAPTSADVAGQTDQGEPGAEVE